MEDDKRKREGKGSGLLLGLNLIGSSGKERMLGELLKLGKGRSHLHDDEKHLVQAHGSQLQRSPDTKAKSSLFTLE